MLPSEGETKSFHWNLFAVPSLPAVPSVVKIIGAKEAGNLISDSRKLCSKHVEKYTDYKWTDYKKKKSDQDNSKEANMQPKSPAKNDKEGPKHVAKKKTSGSSAKKAGEKPTKKDNDPKPLIAKRKSQNHQRQRATQSHPFCKEETRIASNKSWRTVHQEIYYQIFHLSGFE